MNHHMLDTPFFTIRIDNRLVHLYVTCILCSVLLFIWDAKKTIVEVEGIVIDIVALHLQVKEPSRG